MSNTRIKELLSSLQAEIQKTDLDAETLSQIETLEQDIHDLLDVDGERGDPGSVIENARFLETQFAAEYPVAERFLRELVEALGRMGV